MALNPISVETHVLSDWTLADTLNMLSKGVFLRPNFQRAFVWDVDLISELIRSVFLGYHIGSLLLWQVASEQIDKMSLEPLAGVHVPPDPDQADGKNDTVVVLDGQQRLTALHYAFFAPEMDVPDGQQSKSRVAFFLRVDEFMRNRQGTLREASNPALTAVTYRPVHEGTAFDPTHEEHLLPLPILIGGRRPIGEWLDRYEEFWGKRRVLLEGETADLERRAQTTKEQSDIEAWFAKAAELEDANQYYGDAIDNGSGGSKLDKALQSVLDYKVQFVRLRGDESPDRVKDTFMQVNRHGKQLNNFELFSAEASWDGLNPRLLVEKAAQQLKDDGLEVSPERLQYFIPQLMLLRKYPEFVHDRAYSMRKFETYYGRFFLPGKNEAKFEDIDAFQKAWDAAFEDLQAGLLALRDDELFGAVDRGNYHCFALYDGLVPTLAAIWSDAHRVESDVYEPLRDKRIQQWYWSRVFSQESYMNAPSDVEWREREENAEMMVADHREVMDWLKDLGNDPSSRPAVVRQTERQMSPSQTRRLAHAHDRDGEDPGSSRDRADTARYYSVLNFMNTIRPQQLLTGDPLSRNSGHGTEREIHIARILTQEWAERKDGVSDKELGSPFNQILVDEYSAKVIRLGVVPACYFLQIEGACQREGVPPTRYVERLASHCISAEMYNSLTAQTGTDRDPKVQNSLRSVRNKTLDGKLVLWEQGQRANREKLNINTPVFSAQNFRQLLKDRELRFLDAFGQHVFSTDLGLGRTDRELHQRVVDIERNLRRSAICSYLAKITREIYLDRVQRFESNELPASLKRDGAYQTAKRAAQDACRASTVAEAEGYLGKWTLAHSHRFAQVFYDDLSQREKWPSGPDARDTFLRHLDNMTTYRNTLMAHDETPVSNLRATRTLGRESIAALEKLWHLGST